MKKLLLSIALMLLATSMFAITSGFSVHVKVAGSSVAPHIWAWDAVNNYSNGTITGNNWPGTQISGVADANGYFTFTFPDGVDLASSTVIFNDGVTPTAKQTSNITVSTETYYNVGADFSYTIGLVTAEPTLLAPEKSVVVCGNTVKVASASAVEIINISGVTVQSSVVYGEFVSNPLSAGLYIVVVDGKATKVLIK